MVRNGKLNFSDPETPTQSQLYQNNLSIRTNQSGQKSTITLKLLYIQQKRPASAGLKFGDGEIRTLGAGSPTQHLSRVPP